MYFFFIQAEDGIRDGHVTGVQTCALPISDQGTKTIVAACTEPRLPVVLQVRAVEVETARGVVRRVRQHQHALAGAQSPAGDFEVRADRAADHRYRGGDAQPLA